VEFQGTGRIMEPGEENKTPAERFKEHIYVL